MPFGIMYFSRLLRQAIGQCEGVCWPLCTEMEACLLYFGSVRFFKHLFLLILILMILVPLCFAIFYGVAYTETKKDLDEAIAQVEKIRTVVQSDEVDAQLDSDSTIDVAAQGGTEHSYSYQDLYPEMHVERGGEYIADDATIYLTFDDGPSDRTAEILNILAEKDVKATFFTVYSGTDSAQELMRRIVNEGHTIAVHSYTHRYSEIYASVEAYLTDFYSQWTYIHDVTGVYPTIFRFPGGSINAYNGNIYQDIITEMTRRGFTYYDWNVSSADAGTVTLTKEEITESVLAQCETKMRSVVLMHDSNGKVSTVASLDGLIDTLREKGYTFDRITNDVRPVIIPYRDFES